MGPLVPPTLLRRVEPDLSGLTPLARPVVVIAEVGVDKAGRVHEPCILRGIRADVDRRVLAAVRRWRFSPGRLRIAGVIGGKHLAAGAAVPVAQVVTVTVGLGKSGSRASARP